MMSNKQGFGAASINSPTEDKSRVIWGGDETVSHDDCAFDQIKRSINQMQSVLPPESFKGNLSEAAGRRKD